MADVTTFPDACNPTYLNYNDVPEAFNKSDDALCGISYPSSLFPQSNFTACCAGNITSSNDCFQYCAPNGEWDTAFSDCLYENLMNRTGSLEVWCNEAARERKQEESLAPAIRARVRLMSMGVALMVVAGVNVRL